MKICKKCGKELPSNRKFFGSTPSGYLRGACRECVRKKVRQHSEENPEMLQRRLERRKAQDGGINVGVYAAQLVRKQKGKCYYCGDDVKAWSVEVDRKTPVSRGGSNSLSNFVAACSQCNKEKHNKTEEEYRVWKRRVGK
jgi:5-methylcytosine-specific restriction endonuclease McrA